MPANDNDDDDDDEEEEEEEAGWSASPDSTLLPLGLPSKLPLSDDDA